MTVNDYFDKIYYLNLAKDTDRNQHILDQFAKFDITNFERVEGTLFDTIPDQHLWRNFNKERLTEKYIKGQLGCRAVHLEAIKRAKASEYKQVLIFEDDIKILANPNNILERNKHKLKDWDMLYFGGLIEPHFRSQVVLGHAYAVKHTLFDDLIHLGEASGMEIDNFYAKIIQHMSYNYNSSGRYNIVLLQPFNTIMADAKFGSNSQDVKDQFFKMRDEVGIRSLENIIKHIGNTENKTMIEIGSYVGESTTIFAKYFEKVIAIDPFIDNYDPEDLACRMASFDKVYEKFIENTKPYSNIKHIKKPSDVALLDINEKVDFVYIDGMHTFNQVTNDIINYKPLIKKEGYIGGHDYNPLVWKGVVEAIDKTLGKPDKIFEDTSWIKKL